MKAMNSGHLGILSLLFSFVIAGCETVENGGTGFSSKIKTRGVYTTLAIADPGLDMPGSGYQSKTSFGPGETPAAVVVGYGFRDQPQLLTLELIESSTGHSLFSKDYYASHGKALMQTLSIRLSGDYQLKLTSDGSVFDTCQFTVTRTNKAATTTVQNANSMGNYARVGFAASVDAGPLPELFARYNDKLGYSIATSVNKEAGSTNRDLFAQRFPGKVVIQCRLDFQGRILNPKILENDLDDECGAVIQKALLDRSPYDAWPEDAHQKLGSDYRELTVKIYLN